MDYEIIRLDLQGVNSYLVKTNKGLILVDTGGHLILDKQFDNRRDILIGLLDKYGCTPENLQLIVLTHGDNDHATNALHISKKYQAKIAMHKSDISLVQKPNIDEAMKSFNYRSPIFKIVFALMKTKIKKLMQKTIEDFEPFTPDILLSNGDSLIDYGFDAKIIHIPGHTDGSIVILAKNGELIASDIFANIKKPELAPNAYDFKLLKQGAEKLKSMNVTTVFPGHGDAFKM